MPPTPTDRKQQLGRPRIAAAAAIVVLSVMSSIRDKSVGKLTLKEQAPEERVLSAAKEYAAEMAVFDNPIHCWSGQAMATWIYHGEDSVDSKYITWHKEEDEKVLRNSDAPKIQTTDTLFV